MATPAYIGSNQPQAGKSAWSGLTSWFGRSPPVYKAAATSTNTTSTSDDDASATTSAQPTRVIVIVPHGGFIPAVEWPGSQQ